MARSDALALDDQLCFALYAASHAIQRVYRPILDRLGLTYPQFLVMMVLWETDGIGVTEIGDRLGLDSGTLTPLLRRMESAGSLRRDRSAVDERRIEVWLTDTGRNMRDEVEAATEPVRCAAGASDNPAELHRLLVDLRTHLGA